MIQLDIEKIMSAKKIDAEKIIRKVDRKFKDFLEWFSQWKMERYDARESIVYVVDGAYVPGWEYTDDSESAETYVFGRDGKVATLDDFADFLPTFNKLGEDDDAEDAFKSWRKRKGLQAISVDDLEEEFRIKRAQSENLLLLDVPREVLNRYDDVKKQNRVPFDVLVKATKQWVDKAIQEQNAEVLGNALMTIYDEYGIDTYKARGSWKKYKG